MGQHRATHGVNVQLDASIELIGVLARAYCTSVQSGSRIMGETSLDVAACTTELVVLRSRAELH
jgi:hypothetical protein